uniref:hypothetical protein n=1 Tax=Brachyspira catarrhinii TaxID=2528966 RepID=UPI003F4B57B2
MEHSFNIDIAKEYGIAEAVLYNNFLFWIKKNKANGTNYKDGKFWTYSSIKALCNLFPYMTKNQIEYSIKKLIDNNILVKAVHNDNKYNRTTWYAFCEEPEDLAVIPNPYKKEEKPEDEEKDKEEDKKDESGSEKSEKQDGNLENGDSDFQKSISEISEMEDEKIQNGSSNFQKSHANNLTDFASDTSTNNLTNTACVKKVCDYTTPYGLLNYSSWTWDSFKAAYIHWYTLLTGRPVNDLIQTLPKKDIGSDKLAWLENAFKNRKVNAGVAIFETLEYIAQNKGCQENVYLRAANYYDGVMMRLSDMRLAEKDGISTEGTEHYPNPSFDHFKY